MPQAKRFLDSDEYVISYEESEKRLIKIAQMLILLESLIILSLLVLLEYWFISRYPIILNPEKEGHFPIPSVVFMGKCKNGHMVIFRQLNNIKLEFDWDFKVPTSINHRL